MGGEAPVGGVERVDDYVAACRAAVLDELERLLHGLGWAEASLDALLIDFPVHRELRPALGLATARALHAGDAAVLKGAAALELVQAGFVLHADVEAESPYRRGQRRTRSRRLPIAGNTGDGLFALALTLVRDSGALVCVAEAMRAGAAGRATELAWIDDNVCRFPEGQLRPTWEALAANQSGAGFVAPVRLGCVVAGAHNGLGTSLARFARHLGIAARIADELGGLRESAEGERPRSECDLWAGRRTLALLHALDVEPDAARAAQAERILGRCPPASDGAEAAGLLVNAIDEAHHAGHLDSVGRSWLLSALRHANQAGERARSEADVRFLAELIARHDSTGYARRVAAEHVELARVALAGCAERLAPGAARDFLLSLPDYVLERARSTEG